MRLGLALFLASLLIFALCFAYPIFKIAESLRLRYLEGVEEPLVDQANILAAVIGEEMAAGTFSTDSLGAAVASARARPLSARIYDLLKERVDSHLYITDAKGIVLFDSEDPSQVGADFSRWHDVQLTLAGQYGARTTRSDPADPSTAVLYVAAPIRVRGELAGVLTVVEPTTSINTFMAAAKPEVLRVGGVAAIVAIGLSLLVTLWLSGQLGRLTRYAHDVSAGKRVPPPRLATAELRDLGGAFETMRESLEGKKYVEEYVQTLTHEIKSPVSAIQGAAELLEEPMPEEQRDQFLANIRNEASRIQNLVERMLNLSELEMKKHLETRQPIPLAALVRAVFESKEPMMQRKGLTRQVEIDERVAVRGDPFLLQQAIANLVQNAIDFSPARGKLELRGRATGESVELTLDDQGPGLPDFAKERVFQRFFSLQRPDTGKKSTGLGLNFVREVAVLHGGAVRLENLPAAGLRAILTLPASR